MKPTLSIEEQIEKLLHRMFSSRIDQDDEKKGWNHIWMSLESRKAKEIIREHLAAGHIVTTGWMSTACRGYHDYHIYWKERKKK